MKEINFYKIESDFYYPIGEFISKNIIVAKEMAYTLRKIYKKDDIINFWCRGSSGAMIASLVARYFPKCCICHVKKEGENSHAEFITYKSDGYNVIIDDFILSGDTINEIYKHLSNSTNSTEVDCIAVTRSIIMNKLKIFPKNLICYGIIHQGNYLSKNDLLNEFDIKLKYHAPINLSKNIHRDTI